MVGVGKGRVGGAERLRHKQQQQRWDRWGGEGGRERERD